MASRLRLDRLAGAIIHRGLKVSKPFYNTITLLIGFSAPSLSTVPVMMINAQIEHFLAPYLIAQVHHDQLAERTYQIAGSERG